jgi:hypothetical protein
MSESFRPFSPREAGRGSDVYSHEHSHKAPHSNRVVEDSILLESKL